MALSQQLYRLPLRPVVVPVSDGGLDRGDRDAVAAGRTGAGWRGRRTRRFAARGGGGCRAVGVGIIEPSLVRSVRPKAGL